MLEKVMSWIRSLHWKRVLLVLLIILGVGGLIFWQSQKSSTQGYIIESVTRQDITESVSESGNLTIAGMTHVYSPTNGIIEEVYIQNGELVGIDQQLFKVKSTATEDDRAAALAALTAKVATLKTAEQTKVTLQSSLEAARQAVLDAQQAVDDKNDELSTDPNFYSTNERDSIDSALTSARYTFNAAEKKYVEADTAINSARAAVASAQLTYDSTKDRVVSSPTIGTISNLSIAVGNSIEANGGTSLFPALTIGNFSSNQIILAINESDIAKIQVGQKASVNADAIDNVTYDGVVKRIDDIGKDDAGVITYNVYIDIVNPDNRLKSGMTVDVDILTRELVGVLAVPNTAVKPYQGGKSVRVLNKKTGELENIPITTGTKGKTYTEIIQGIDEGTEIVVSLKNDQVERSSPLGF